MMTCPILAVSADEGTSDIYITSGDVIRNFKMESFNGMEITSGGTVVGLDDQIKFEMGALWTTNPNDVVPVYVSQVNDIVYIRYDIPFYNSFNAYTNLDMNECTNASLDSIEESIQCAEYRHRGLFGDTLWMWKAFLKWNHLDIDGIRDYNAQHNIFSGDIKFSFDIDDSPLPDSLTDYNGNPITKQFDYIGIKTIFLNEGVDGLLSAETPTVVGTVPDDYVMTDPGKFKDGTQSSYDPTPTLNDPFISDTADMRLQYQSNGSSCNPTQKGGALLYDPEEKESSTENCEFSVNIGSLSPLVTLYSSTLSYKFQQIETQDTAKYVFPFGVENDIKTVENEDHAYSETRSTALYVSNRYIHFEVGVIFTVYSAYNVEALDSGEVPELQFPQEYYDNLVFSSVVDGFGGGVIHEKGVTYGLAWSDEEIMTFIIVVIIIIILACGVYLFFRRRRNAISQPQMNVNIKK